MGLLSEQASEFGIIGLTAAGRTLALRLAGGGNRVSLWDPSFDAVEQFAREHMDTRGGLAGFEDLADFFDSLALPPRVACFLAADGDAARRAAQLAGAGAQLIDAGLSQTDGDDALCGEIEARLLALPD